MPGRNRTYYNRPPFYVWWRGNDFQKSTFRQATKIGGSRKIPWSGALPQPPSNFDRRARHKDDLRQSQKEFLFLEMAEDVHSYEELSALRRRHSLSDKRKRWPQLLHPSRVLKFIAIVVLGAPIRTTQWGCIIVANKDRYGKLTNSITSTKSSCVDNGYSDVETLVCSIWDPEHDSDWQRTTVSVQLFRSAVHCNRHKTGYHDGVPSTNQWASARFIDTLIERLRHHVDEQERNLGILIHSLTYGYNTQVHRMLRTLPFSLALSRNSLMATALGRTTIAEELIQLPSDRAKLKVIERMQRIWQKTEKL